jgi:hypothetical protein
VSPNERRQALIELLCRRRHDTYENLAKEFNVCKRTIQYDIEELTLSILGVWQEEFSKFADFDYTLAVLSGSSTPPWAKGLVLDVDGYVVDYYRKD